ncbi:MAG: ADP-ribosylglycohydrolase family protein [Gemmatimonadales bacterium]|nr:ADP-ribosylglycohydrolase family protein [Gemmatimonadales bacterium]
MTDRTTSLTGCLLGQALGDALGFVVEAEPPSVASEYVKGLRGGQAGRQSHPKYPFGQYSDDTQLARELLLSFVEAGGWRPDAFAGRLAALFAQDRDVGAGPGTRAAAVRLSGGAHWSEAGTPAPYAGNGSAMRAAPLGLLYGDDTRSMVATAIEQSSITHRDPRCSAGALVVAGATRLAARGTPVRSDDFLETLADLAAPADRSVAKAVRGLQLWVHLPCAAAARWLRGERMDPADTGEWGGISAFVTPSVVWSLYAFLRSPDDYWTTVCTAIEVGGDTDTMAAIAGAIAGARLGPSTLPAALTERLTDRGEWGREDLVDLARRAARLVEGGPRVIVG